MPEDESLTQSKHWPTAPEVRLSHVIYQTFAFDDMIQWYTNVLAATVVFRDSRLALLTFDDEHHRIGFANLNHESFKARLQGEEVPHGLARSGVNHVGYSWPDLGTLLGVYKHLRDTGIKPARCIRHGITLSFYYRDPDENMLEFQIDLLDPASATRFMGGPAFKAHPGGMSFDPEEVIAAYESGEAVDSLIFYPEQGEASGSSWVTVCDTDGERVGYD
jgi:catechol-2,3-dioxygenase